MSENLKTLGAIAAELDISRDRAGYIVATRGIEPTGRSGLYRLFDAAGVAAIESAALQMDHVAALRGSSCPPHLAGIEHRG